MSEVPLSRVLDSPRRGKDSSVIGELEVRVFRVYDSGFRDEGFRPQCSGV